MREEIHGVQLVAGEARNALRLFGKYNELHKSLEHFVYVCVCIQSVPIIMKMGAGIPGIGNHIVTDVVEAGPTSVQVGF